MVSYLPAGSAGLLAMNSTGAHVAHPSNETCPSKDRWSDVPAMPASNRIAPRSPQFAGAAVRLPATGAYPNVRSFLNMELFKAEHFGAIGTTLQAGGKIVDGVLGQASSTFGQVCRASRPCAPNRAESRLAFFA